MLRRSLPPRHPRALTLRAAPMVLLSLSGGCMVGPNYSTPDSAVNQSWIGVDTPEPSPGIDPRWWNSFNDPTLTALVNEALAQNLSLRAAGLRVLEARAARGIAVGRFFPQLQEAVGGIGANQLSANDVNNGGDRSFAQDSVGLQAAWELDFWGKFRRGIEAADAQLLFTVADYDAVLVSLASDVATEYIVLRSFQERLGIARDNVALQQETLRLTEARFKAGAVSELDVTTARATLANTQALIPEFEDAIRQAMLRLCVLLGRPPSTLESELATANGAAPVVPSAPPTIAAGIPAELLRRRPDVRAAERLAAAQSARIGEAVADLLPRIAIAGSTGFVSTTYEGGHTPDLGNIFDADSFSGFIGLQVNWPILNYGRIESNIRVQDARYEQAVAAYQQSVLSAASDVESGLSLFLHARERASFLSDSVDATQRSVEISLIQYRAGAVDFIRVNDAQTKLVEQQDRLVTATASISLGAVRAYRALGGGWEVREGGEFVDGGTIKRMRDRTNWGDVISPDWEQGKDLGFPRPASEPSEPESPK